MTEEKKMILLNFKKVSGDDALILTRKLEKIDSDIKEKFDIVLAVQPQDSQSISRETSIPIFIQDISTHSVYLSSHGLDTGPKKSRNIRGVILNHPEKKLPYHVLEEKMATARVLGLEIMLCSNNLEEGIFLSDKYQPHYIVIENEALIGKNIPFSQYCPELVKEAVARINNKIMFGGGIKGPEDIICVITQGGSGVLISSLIVKASDPLEALRNLLEPVLYIRPQSTDQENPWFIANKEVI